MRFALPFWLVCAALVTAMLVLGAFARPPEVGRLPDLTLRDPSGQSVDLASTRDRVWVASLVSAGCIDACESTMGRLSRLHDGLPEDVPLVTLLVDGEGLWPRRPEAAMDRPNWVVCQGNEVDADNESEVRRVATDSLLVPAEDLDALKDRTPSAVVVPVDDRGRPLGLYRMDDTDPGDDDPVVDGAWGDVEFRIALDPYAGREAILSGFALLLISVGFVLALRGEMRIHPICILLAALTTMVLLAFGFSYADFASSIPFRGSGWTRPLYFSVLVTHTVLNALVVVLALTSLYHVLRGQFERHVAMLRWVAPSWIGVALGGVIIYYLASVWFPAP